MSGNHYDKWILKSILGIVLITASVFGTYYTIAYIQDHSRWVLYATAVSIALCVGIIQISGAFIHKMKHDIRVRQRAQKE